MQQHYAEKAVSDYVRAAVTTAVSIHEQDLPGDILIFLTGQEECESAVSMLEEEARRFRRAQGNSLRLMPVALYAGLPAASQLQAFEITPRGYRKVTCLPVGRSIIALDLLTSYKWVHCVATPSPSKCFKPFDGNVSHLVSQNSCS